jgi:hypothetical protein
MFGSWQDLDGCMALTEPETTVGRVRWTERGLGLKSVLSRQYQDLEGAEYGQQGEEPGKTELSRSKADSGGGSWAPETV